LSAGETVLRLLCKDKLVQLIRARAAYRKQRGKFWVVREGDENTNFHHAHTSHRLRKNQIKALEVDGVRCTRHVDKAKILDDHFSTLLGAPTTPVWDFELADVSDTMGVDPAPWSPRSPLQKLWQQLKA
jgi:hypothetical protein